MKVGEEIPLCVFIEQDAKLWLNLDGKRHLFVILLCGKTFAEYDFSDYK